MDRRSLSLRWPMVVLSLTLLSGMAAGCKSLMESVALVYEGNDLPSEWDGLKGKKVVVVCKALTDDFGNTGAARILTDGICDRLKARVKKIQIIAPEKVAKLRDEKGIDDYLEIGKRLGAEKVVGVDIESFSVLDGQTLFRGRATVSIQVWDVAEKQLEWHKAPPQIEYPKICSTPAQDLPETEFRNQFVAILADQIARCFYPHDRNEDYGSDADSIR